MPTPDASQWNIGGVGPSGVGAGVGHIHFRLFVLISFAFGSQRRSSFQWNMGLSHQNSAYIKIKSKQSGKVLYVHTTVEGYSTMRVL